MARSKAAKRLARRKQAKRVSAMAPMPRRGARRGRPPTRHDVGPTAQTVAKLRPDTLTTLRALKIDGEPFLDATQVEAGEEILRAWITITAGCGYRSHFGYAPIDRASSERLQKTWRHWSAELFPRCYVRPALVVQWINPKLFGETAAGCDTDPKGSAGVLRKALVWWKLAARDAGRDAQ